LGRDLLSLPGAARASGRVVIYNQDLKTLADIPDASMDAVAAVSALEHNTPESLPLVVAELLRVLRPGGLLLATLGAARDQDWFHEPSHGWNYTEVSLRQLFELSATASSNYARYDELFNALKGCAELRTGLASFYSRSGDNGMPWGRWDPQYQPVGVCKVKN
jgi:SAM-dependent methyltransferase